MKTIQKTLVLSLLVAGCAFAATLASASEGEGGLEPSEANVNDQASLQRGAKLFVNYCFGCHSTKYMRYQRLQEDLGLSKDMVTQNFIFGDQKIGDPMTVSMRPEDAQKWFGKAPPDLSLIGRSRGPDWIYNFLRSFYRDDSGGWNNTVLKNAAMPNVLWSLQGIQTPVYETHQEDGTEIRTVSSLELAQPGLMDEEEYDRAVRDIAAYLTYVGEPALLVRKDIGVWVIVFLAFFAFIAYLLKAEYWRDVH